MTQRAETGLGALRVPLAWQGALFLALVFAGPWIFGLVWESPAQPKSLWEFLASFIPIVWMPTLFAVALTLTFEGGAGLRAMLRTRLTCAWSRAHWITIAAVCGAGSIAVATLSARLAGDGADWILIQDIPMMIFIQVITGAVGEELGWRGYVLPRLAPRFREIGAAWVMGVCWALWHLPAWFNPGLPHHMFPLLPAMISIASFGVFMSFVFFRSGGSVLATIAAHLCFNVTTGLLGVQLASPVFWWVLAGVFGAFALVWTLFAATRRNHA